MILKLMNAQKILQLHLLLGYTKQMQTNTANVCMIKVCADPQLGLCSVLTLVLAGCTVDFKHLAPIFTVEVEIGQVNDYS